MELNKEFVEAVEELIQETKCPICLDFFTNPRSGPCQHNFCEECIWEVIKDNHSECPSCRYPGCNRRSLAKNNTLRNVTHIVRKLAASLGLAAAPTEDSKFEKAWPPKPAPKKRAQRKGKRSNLSPQAPEQRDRERAEAAQTPRTNEAANCATPASPVLSCHRQMGTSAEQSSPSWQRKRPRTDGEDALAESDCGKAKTVIDASSLNAETMRRMLGSRIVCQSGVKGEDDQSTTSRGSNTNGEKGKVWGFTTHADLSEHRELEPSCRVHFRNAVSGSSAEEGPQSGLETPCNGQSTWTAGEQNKNHEIESAKATVRRGGDREEENLLPCKRKTASSEEAGKNEKPAAAGTSSDAPYTSPTPVQGGNGSITDRPSPQCLIRKFTAAPESEEEKKRLGVGGGGARCVFNGGRLAEGVTRICMGNQNHGGPAQQDEGGTGAGSVGMGVPSILFTGLEQEEGRFLTWDVKLLRGQCCKQFEDGVSHVVCKVDAQGFAARTLKYCCGLLSGAKMVTPLWLTRCKSEGKWREPAADEVVAGCSITQKVHEGVKARDAAGAGMGRTKGLVRAQGGGAAGLLSPERIGGFRFLIVGRFGHPTCEEMLLLLRLAGAEVWKEEPGTEEEMGRTIVICDGARDRDRSRLKMLLDGGAVVVKPSYVMDSISQYQPQPLEHYLRTEWAAVAGWQAR